MPPSVADFSDQQLVLFAMCLEFFPHAHKPLFVSTFGTLFFPSPISLPLAADLRFHLPFSADPPSIIVSMMFLPVKLFTALAQAEVNFNRLVPSMAGEIFAFPLHFFDRRS